MQSFDYCCCLCDLQETPESLPLRCAVDRIGFIVDVYSNVLLEEHVEADDVILSSLTFGQYIPAHTGARAFLAHWAQTVDFFEKQRQVDQIFSQNSSLQTANTIIEQYGVDYIVCGPAERAIGSCNLVMTAVGSMVFETPEVQIIKVAN